LVFVSVDSLKVYFDQKVVFEVPQHRRQLALVRFVIVVMKYTD